MQAFIDDQDVMVTLPVTPGLREVPLFGAGKLAWKGNPVAMICFKTDQEKLLFLFVAKRNSVTNPPTIDAEASALSNLTIQSWSEGENIYVLASEMEPDQLRGYL